MERILGMACVSEGQRAGSPAAPQLITQRWLLGCSLHRGGRSRGPGRAHALQLAHMPISPPSSLSSCAASPRLLLLGTTRTTRRAPVRCRGTRAPCRRTRQGGLGLGLPNNRQLPWGSGGGLLGGSHHSLAEEPAPSGPLLAAVHARHSSAHAVLQAAEPEGAAGQPRPVVRVLAAVGHDACTRVRGDDGCIQQHAPARIVHKLHAKVEQGLRAALRVCALLHLP
mmetsp:Transcript_2305/g.5485  ORF Transcript_2305/g.5485 Transcript_2305/m.5485 type:complete len:225 (-) Transcript_2305:1782-2456(-)